MSTNVLSDTDAVAEIVAVGSYSLPRDYFETALGLTRSGQVQAGSRRIRGLPERSQLLSVSATFA
jgi:hypothetical protein